MRRSHRRQALLAAAFLTLSFTAAAQSNLPAESFRAIAVNMSGFGPGSAGTVDIVIQRWSSDAERDRLLTVFKEQGPEKLLDALQDTRPVGYIKSPGSLGWDLRFARQWPDEEGGRRIVVLTDRPMGFREVASSARTVDYPFTVIEFHLDRNGKGEGRASVATKITYSKRTNMIELENYGIQPVMLTEVTTSK
jgi:hypothetical protein